MDNRRLAVIVGLGIVELWVIGLMIRSLGGGRPQYAYRSPTARLAVDVQTPGGADRSAKTLETGPTPHVVIDDELATLRVSVRPGSSVSVVEDTRISGWGHPAVGPLSIERTADGVRIERADAGMSIGLGSVHRELDVVVPPAARVEIENAGSMSLLGLRGDLSAHSDDGSILVRDARGGVDVKTDDGRIELDAVDAPSIDVHSENGRVTLDRVTAATVAISTDNGRVDIARSLLRGGKIETDNGRIRLALDPRSDVTVSAHTSSGDIDAQAPLTKVAGSDDDAPATIKVGAGSGRLDVGSDDGSITVLAAGA